MGTLASHMCRLDVTLYLGRGRSSGRWGHHWKWWLVMQASLPSAAAVVARRWSGGPVDWGRGGANDLFVVSCGKVHEWWTATD